MENLTTFISGITVIFGVFGVFLFLKLLSTWKKMDYNFIKARTFLQEKFILKNIFMIFIVGLLIAIHNFIEYIGLGQPEFYYNAFSARFPMRLIAVSELFAALLLVELMMYRWLNLSKKGKY